MTDNNMIRSNASINEQVDKLSADERDISVKVQGVRRVMRAKNPEDAVRKLTAELKEEKKQEEKKDE